jgi:hypothetical protein
MVQVRRGDPGADRKVAIGDRDRMESAVRLVLVL